MARKIVTTILAVLGVLAIIGIGMWGSIKIASLVPNVFSSLASVGASSSGNSSAFGSEKIVLSTPALTVNGKSTFVLSWTHEKKTTEGSYTFRYDCANAVFFISPTPPAGAPATIYCNTSFNFLNQNNTITLTPILEANAPVDVKLYVDFTPNGATKPTVTGTLKLTVMNTGGSGVATTTPQTPTKPVTPTTPATPTNPGGTIDYPLGGGSVRPSDPNGYTDLRVLVLQVGVVDRTTGAFYPSETPSRSQKIAVRFSVENLGTKTSPQFDFNAILPTYPQNTFQSPTVQGLAPGERTEFVMGFEGATVNGNFLTITIDPLNRFTESDKNNNVARYTITTVP